jgi:HopA1 effector protein family
LGRRSRSVPATLLAGMEGAERRTYLVRCLREELYSSFYCHGRPVPARWGALQPVSSNPWLVTAMSEANTGRGSWDPGWTVQRLDREEAVVATRRLRMRVPLTECRASGDVCLGSEVSVRLQKGLPALSPGFYTALGEAEATDAASSAGVLRVYWNVGRAGAPALVGALTSRLNAESIPFRLKVADHPVRLDRCDAAVLYLPSEAFARVREPLRYVAAALAANLRPAIPAFTLELAPGVGLAEDNGTGESFGVRRCALLADAIVRAHERGIARPDGRIATVATRFAEDGVSIDAPYRDPSFGRRHVL